MRIGGLQKFIVPIFVSFLVFPVFVFADLGPKPSMGFRFVYETENKPLIISGQQIECENENCIPPKPLTEGGPQGFHCGADSCYSLAYNYAPYHKLIIRFSDRVRETGVFKTNAFNSEYIIKVNDYNLAIDGEIFPASNFSTFGRALLVTIIIEVFLASLFVFAAKIPKKFLLSVLLVNLVSLPIVWFAFPLLNLQDIQTITISEIFAVLFEALVIFLLNKKISFIKIFLLSFLMNLASFLCGIIFKF